MSTLAAELSSKNPTSFALGFVSLALLRASKNRFQHRPNYVKPTVLKINEINIFVIFRGEVQSVLKYLIAIKTAFLKLLKKLT